MDYKPHALALKDYKLCGTSLKDYKPRLLALERTTNSALHL